MRRQISFDPLDYNCDREAAKHARDEYFRELKKSPYAADVRRSVLKNQLEKYQSFGVEGRGFRDVFYIDYTDTR